MGEHSEAVLIHCDWDLARRTGFDGSLVVAAMICYNHPVLVYTHPTDFWLSEGVQKTSLVYVS